MKLPADAENPRVLYIEDDPRSRLVVRKLLENAGCKVYEAVDGEQGVEKALALNPDVIILDIMLPTMDGVEVARIVRETEPISKIPIIALTAKAMAGDREQILAAGCNDYIVKPTNIHLLLQKLSQVLRRDLSLAPQQGEQEPHG
jgi:CheY-like chemotaxis protein